MDYKKAEKKVIELLSAGKRKPADNNLLIEIHKILIADKPENWYCSTCSGKMDAVFWDLKLKYYQSKKYKEMAKQKGNYRFSKAAKENGVSAIVIVADGKTETITEENMTDAQAKRVLKNPAYAHNIEKVGEDEKPEKAPKTEEEKAAKAAKKEAKRGRPAKDENKDAGQMIQAPEAPEEQTKPEE